MGLVSTSKNALTYNFDANGSFDFWVTSRNFDVSTMQKLVGTLWAKGAWGGSGSLDLVAVVGDLTATGMSAPLTANGSKEVSAPYGDKYRLILTGATSPNLNVTLITEVGIGLRDNP